MNEVTDLLIKLNQTAEFKLILQALIKERPFPPEYYPCKTRDADYALLEQIKHKTARQQEFDKVVRLLTGSTK